MSDHKKVIFIESDKGGVGRSQVLIWVIENMIANGGNTFDFEIIEADKLRDVSHRYGGAVTYAPLKQEFDSEASGVGRIFEAIEVSQKEYVFVNLPAVANDHIGSFIELISESIEEMGAELFVIFVADAQSYSRKLYAKSKEKGLLSIAGRSAVVLNGVSSSTPDIFQIYADLTGDVHWFLMPKLDDECIGVINAEAELPYFAIIKDWPCARRMVVEQWIKSAAPLRELITTPLLDLPNGHQGVAQ